MDQPLPQRNRRRRGRRPSRPSLRHPRDERRKLQATHRSSKSSRARTSRTIRNKQKHPEIRKGIAQPKAKTWRQNRAPGSDPPSHKPLHQPKTQKQHSQTCTLSESVHHTPRRAARISSSLTPCLIQNVAQHAGGCWPHVSPVLLCLRFGVLARFRATAFSSAPGCIFALPFGLLH